MISFASFTMEDTGPIYLQIITYIKRGIVAGTIRDGEELPSRRVLSTLLGVNPNTVQKAYRILEEEALILSHTGAKSCVAADDGTVIRLRRELLYADARGVITALKQMGLTKEDALSLLEERWDTVEEMPPSDKGGTV